MAYLEITTKIGCRLNCVYCPQGILIKAYKQRSSEMLLTFDKFQRYLERVPANVNITFAGMCEPWLNPDCTKMVAYAYKKGHQIKTFTTLVGMKLSDIPSLESISYLEFRVHLPSREGYEKISVDKDYLRLLAELLRSKINIACHYHGELLHPDVSRLLEQNGVEAKKLSLYSRANNIEIKNKHKLYKKRGVIRCGKNLDDNILLPNGDVVLCCMDYEMKHILGNLNVEDYASIIRGKALAKVRQGLVDDDADILCRHCDMYAFSVGLYGRIANSVYELDHYLYHLKNIKDLNGMKQFGRKVIAKTAGFIRAG